MLLVLAPHPMPLPGQVLHAQDQKVYQHVPPALLCRLLVGHVWVLLGAKSRLQRATFMKLGQNYKMYELAWNSEHRQVGGKLNSKKIQLLTYLGIVFWMTQLQSKTHLTRAWPCLPPASRWMLDKGISNLHLPAVLQSMREHCMLAFITAFYNKTIKISLSLKVEPFTRSPT